MLKQEMVPVPEAVAHLRAEALMNGALHAPLYRSTEGLPLLVQQFNFQAILSLADYRTGGGPCLDSDASVGCQTYSLPP